jgi:hypothetical protein
MKSGNRNLKIQILRGTKKYFGGTQVEKYWVKQNLFSSNLVSSHNQQEFDRIFLAL